MDGEWIPKRLAALNSAGRKKNQAGLARALGVPDSRITEIIQGKGKRALSLSEVPGCARYLELSVEMVVALATSKNRIEMMPEPSSTGEQRTLDRETQMELMGSDHYMIRVLEDLVALLADKDLISQDDLPEPARELLERRQKLRSPRSDGESKVD